MLHETVLLHNDPALDGHVAVLLHNDSALDRYAAVLRHDDPALFCYAAVLHRYARVLDRDVTVLVRYVWTLARYAAVQETPVFELLPDDFIEPGGLCGKAGTIGLSSLRCGSMLRNVCQSSFPLAVQLQ